MEEDTEITDDFRSEAVNALMELGLEEDEAEREVDDYYEQY